VKLAACYWGTDRWRVLGQGDSVRQKRVSSNDRCSDPLEHFRSVFLVLLALKLSEWLLRLKWGTLLMRRVRDRRGYFVRVMVCRAAHYAVIASGLGGEPEMNRASRRGKGRCKRGGTCSADEMHVTSLTERNMQLAMRSIVPSRRSWSIAGAADQSPLL